MAASVAPVHHFVVYRASIDRDRRPAHPVQLSTNFNNVADLDMADDFEIEGADKGLRSGGNGAEASGYRG